MSDETPRRLFRTPGLLAPILLAVATFIMGLVGINWGLPSEARNKLDFYDRPPEAPQISQEVMERSWEYFPEFSWWPGHQGSVENLSVRTPRWLFNPIRSYHPDEYVVLKSISNMNPSKWDLDTKFFAWPSLFTYVVAAVLKIASILGLVTLRPSLGFYYEHPDQMARVYLVGRLVVCVFGAGTVAAVYFLGKRLLDWYGGLAAAAVMLLCPAFVVYLHELEPDVPMLFFVTLALIACARIAEGASWRPYVVAGLFTGLAAGCKYDAAYVVLVLAIAHFIGEFQTKSWGAALSLRSWGRLLVGLVCAALVFVVTNPYQVVHFREVWWVASHAVATVWFPLPIPAALIPWHMLTVSLGMGALFFAVVGVFMGGRKTLFLSIALVLLYILQACSASQYIRHYLVLFPFIAVLSAGWIKFVVTTTATAVSPRRRAAIIGVLSVFFASVVVFPLANVSWAFLRQFTGVNTRDAAGKWIAAHVPAGAKLALVAQPWQYTTPPLDTARYKIVITGYDYDKLEAERPEYLILSSADFAHPYGLSLPLRQKLEFETCVRILGKPRKTDFERPLNPLCRPLFVVGFTWPEDMLFTNPRVEIHRFER